MIRERDASDMGYVDSQEYQESVERHLEDLKLQVEAAAAVVVNLEPQAAVYLYGSMARRILGIQNGLRKKFKPIDSDADMMIIVATDPADFHKKLQEELSLRITAREVDEHMLGCFRAGGDNVFWKFMVDQNEKILLYDNNTFSFPWHGNGFVPEPPAVKLAREQVNW